jgi:SOS response regulatory protein OraA/RecX
MHDMVERGYSIASTFLSYRDQSAEELRTKTLLSERVLEQSHHH